MEESAETPHAADDGQGSGTDTMYEVDDRYMVAPLRRRLAEAEALASERGTQIALLEGAVQQIQAENAEAIDILARKVVLLEDELRDLRAAPAVVAHDGRTTVSKKAKEKRKGAADA